MYFFIKQLVQGTQKWHFLSNGLKYNVHAVKTLFDQGLENRLTYLNFNAIFEFFRQFNIICILFSKKVLIDLR